MRTLPPIEEVEKNILLAVIFTIITLGIYYLFWQNHQMKAWNRLLGREKFNFWKWFVLSIFTFGLYHVYHEYVMGQDMIEIQKLYNKPVSPNLPLVSVLLAIFGVPFIADAIQQYELHKLYGRDGL